MPSYLFLFAGVFILTYIIVVVALGIAWRQIKVQDKVKVDAADPVFISVIVALRNEENNLHSLIEALQKQSKFYPHFEALLVDDHSTDNSYAVLSEFEKKYPWMRLFQPPPTLQGKKNALQVATIQAKGNLLAFTDADCLPGPMWLKTLATHYTQHNHPDLIIGLVDSTALSYIQKIFRMESVALVVSAAGAANAGFAVLCNGANLAVKASAFGHYQPDIGIPSGDDVFLLHAVKKMGGKITVLKSPEHMVYTQGASRISDFLNQRSRWVSKSDKMKDSHTIILALIVYFANLSLLLNMIVSAISGQYLPAIVLFALKMLADLFLFFMASDLFRQTRILAFLPLVSVIYPLYVALLLPLSIKRPFQWKGRSYRIY